MPLQDLSNQPSQSRRSPGLVERWLRTIFIEDWNLKLLSLAITLTLWFAVTGQRKPITKRVSGVALSFVESDGLEISNDPPDKVDVTLTGESDKLAMLNPADLVATVSLSGVGSGDHVIRLSSDRVKLDLREGIRIDGFQPTSVSVRLEPMIRRPIEVEIKFEGRPAAGFEVKDAIASPASVTLVGPASRVGRFDKAPTESISLDGRNSSFDMDNVAINIPDQKINVSVEKVRVHVDLAAHGTEKSFTDFPRKP